MVFQLLLEMPCGFSRMGFYSISANMMLNYLFHGLDEMGQSLGHDVHQIYLASTFLWGHLKELIYEIPIDSDHDLIAKLYVS